MRDEFKKHGQAQTIYDESLRMFSQSIQVPARNAMCALTRQDDELTKTLLAKIEVDLHERCKTIPAHQLQQNLYQESQLIIDLYSLNQKDLKNKATDKTFATSTFWRVLFTSLSDA